MNLTTEQIIKLKEQHKATRDKKVCDRIKAVLLINKGYNYNEIAEILLLDDTTIRRHIAEYLEQEKLNNNHNGYNGKLTKIQCDELIAYLQKNTYTDVRPVIHYVLTRYKMYFSRSGMNAWLQQHGFRYKRPHLVPSKHNPGVLTFLCKFFHPLNSTFKFYQKIRHSLIPILDWHSPFSGNIVNC